MFYRTFRFKELSSLRTFFVSQKNSEKKISSSSLIISVFTPTFNRTGRRNSMRILGINAYHADGSVALLVDGKIVFALEEERVSRVKHCAGFPEKSLILLLKRTGISPGDLDGVVIAGDPRAHLLRKGLYFLFHPLPPSGFFPRVVTRLTHLRIRDRLCAIDPSFRSVKIYRVEHHLAHMASAFFSSPFERSAILSVDGFGDFVSTVLGYGEGSRIKVFHRIFYPHSLGILYQAVTQFIGFPKYGDEGKTMGLAPYGKGERYREFFRRVIRWDGMNFSLTPAYFRHFREGVPVSWLSGSPEVPPLYTPLWEKELGPPHPPRTDPGEREQDLAFSVQEILEEVVFSLLRTLYEKTKVKNLCLAGGVALNSVMNGKIPDYTPFENTYIFPSAGDGGLSVGGAQWIYAKKTGKRPSPIGVPLFGPEYGKEEVESALRKRDLASVTMEYLSGESLWEKTVDLLLLGEIGGWFFGPMEFGPRALGGRSIVADPRNPSMKDRLNRRIKHRERFRPFAPSILRPYVSEWFVRDLESPAMLHVIPIRPEKRSFIPAVTHVDGTGRLQTVREDEHPNFYNLLLAFYRRTGVPILLNTSFNENEPIVMTPEDALDCFFRTDMDFLVMERYLLRKKRG
jgi:carbamoyltransferase